MDRRGFAISALAAVGGFLLGWMIPGQKGTVLPDEDNDLGMRYHQWSMLGRSRPLSPIQDWGRQPERFKTYPDAERITLPDPRGFQGLSVEAALERRRSIRDYAPEPLSLGEISRLLHAAQGITDRFGGYRAAPSAGALYPIEVYPIVHHVERLESGVYHYAVQGHALERLRAGDFRAAVSEAGLGQSLLAKAGVCFVLSGIVQRARWKYRERAYRYILMESGHIGQNLYLAAASMGLGACAVGAFLDDDLDDLLGLDGEQEASLYIVAVGKVLGV